MTEREVSESPLTLEDARNHMRRIADARDWGQYHTPLNLQLALVGEVGELCEIFQWKSFCKPSLLSEEERSHLGQELSDVIAYSTRLADRCGIDLAASLTLTVNNKLLLNCCCSHEENKPWVNLSFDNVSLPSTHAVARGYPRHMCLLLSAAVGNLSRIFSEKNELQCDIGLPGWTIEDRTLIATSLASIIFSVVSIAGVVLISQSLLSNNNVEPFPSLRLVLF